MNKTFLIAFVALAIGSLTSCENTINTEEAGIGYLSINLGQDNSIIATKTTDDNIHDVTSEEEIAKYYVQIDNTVKSFNEVYGVSVPLTTGKHTVTAYNIKDADESVFVWDAPRYKGSQTVNIETGKGATCDIICTLANARVTYSFENSVNEVLSDLNLVIKDDSNNQLALYSSTSSDTSAGSLCYIKAETKAKLVLTAKKGEKTLTLETVLKGKDVSDTDYNGVVAQTEYQVKYSVIQQGTGNISIKVNETIVPVALDVEINPNDAE